jgi:hypothetical protein
MSNNAFLHGWDYLNIIAKFSLSTRAIMPVIVLSARVDEKDKDPGARRRRG